MQVRKRPLNKKEMAKKEEDIITILSNSNALTVHEKKLKVSSWQGFSFFRQLGAMNYDVHVWIYL